MESAGFRITSDPEETRIGQPDANEAREFNPLPLRLLVAGDLAPQRMAAVDWSAETCIRRVDSNTFSDLLREWSPELELEVPNHLSETPKKLSLHLSFASLDAFNPDQVVAQIAPLAQLQLIRGLLNQVAEKTIDLDRFKTRLIEHGTDAEWADQLYRSLRQPEPRKRQAERPAEQSSSDENDALNRLLGMVESGQDHTPEKPASPSAGATFLDNLFSVVGGGEQKDRVEKSIAEMMRDDFDQLVEAQLNAVFTHPAFRRLEAAWRGLKLLVSRINFRKNIIIDVLPVDAGHLSEALYHQALLPGHKSLGGESEDPPFSAIILDFAFGERDIELVKDLAGTGASLLVPVIAAAAPSLFGIEEPTHMDRLPVLWQHFEGPAYIQWTAFRKDELAKSIALVTPSLLLRAPFGPDRTAEGFVFNESGQLWGHGSWAVAVAIAQSFAEIQWPTQIVGRNRMIGGLPIWAKGLPLSASISESKERELGDAGFVALRPEQGRDACFVARASTLYHPLSYQDPEQNFQARAHALLDCQLFATRSALFLNQCLLDISPAASFDQVSSMLTAQFRKYFSASGATVTEEHVLCEEVNLNDERILTLRLRPPAPILGYPVSLTMPIPLSRND